MIWKIGSFHGSNNLINYFESLQLSIQFLQNATGILKPLSKNIWENTFLFS